VEVIRNKRYTSKEAIQRFLENTQNPNLPSQKPEQPKFKRMSEAEARKTLERFGIECPD